MSGEKWRCGEVVWSKASPIHSAHQLHHHRELGVRKKSEEVRGKAAEKWGKMRSRDFDEWQMKVMKIWRTLRKKFLLWITNPNLILLPGALKTQVAPPHKPNAGRLALAENISKSKNYKFDFILLLDVLKEHLGK